jgi:thiol:disulfide interchange protein
MNRTPLMIIIGILLFGGVVFTIRQVPQKGITPPNYATGQPIPRSTVETTPSETDGRYVPYSPTAFAAARDRKRILYFHAPWCSTCGPIDKEFSTNEGSIPEGIVVFKTDYDTEVELKKKYAITYQHTFVQVNENGDEVTTWNGGGIEELIKRIR